MTTIVIPTVPGNEDYLEMCLSTICKTTPELINISVIKNDFIGFAKAVNLGILSAINDEGQDDVILLNDDIVMTKRWWDNIKKKIDQGYDIIGDYQNMRRDNHVPFYFVWISKEVIKKIGLLDERFEVGEWEDVDFCLRAIESGFRIGTVDEFSVRHLAHGTLSKLRPEQDEQRMKNKERFLDKWKDTKYARDFA